MTLREIVNVYNAMVLDFFAENAGLVTSGAVMTDTNQLEFKDLGQSADVLIPEALEAKDFTATGTVVEQEPNVTKKTITLDKLKDVTFKVNTEVFNATNRFDLLGKFATEAARAIVRDVETNIGLQYANAGTTIGDGTTGWTADLFLDARKALNDNDAFDTGRFVITRDDTSMYKAGIISAKDKVVIMENGVAKTIKDIPEYADFKIIRSGAIQQVSGVNHDLVVQEKGIIFVNRPMPVEDSKTIEMSVLEKNGITMRTTYWYDANTKTKKLSTDILYAVETLEDKLVIDAQIKA